MYAPIPVDSTTYLIVKLAVLAIVLMVWMMVVSHPKPA
jgi:hypothetical protein